MKMEADFFAVAHRIDQLLREILRVGGHETDALQPFDFINLAQKLGKRHRLLEILSVRVDVLTEQHDLHNAVCNEAFDLCNDFLRLPAALAAAHIRYDTVAAEVVATEHDIDAGFKRIFPVNRKIFHDLVGIFPDIDHHAVLGHAADKVFSEAVDIVGSENQVDEMIAFFELFDNERLLHHASAEGDDHARIFLFVFAKLSETAVDAKIGVFTDGTGIVNDKVSILGFHNVVADGFQDSLELFRIAGVHLASKCCDTGSQEFFAVLFRAFRDELLF